MSMSERDLSARVFLCMLVGNSAGQLLSPLFQAIGGQEVDKVDVPLGLPIWVMIIPMPLSQVALNESIMVVAFAPLAAFPLGISAITVPWATLLPSVVLYIAVPVIIVQLWRRSLLGAGGDRGTCGGGFILSARRVG